MHYPSFITRSAAIVAAVSSLALVQEAEAIVFNISSVPGSSIQFSGQGGSHADINFDPGLTGWDFQIDVVSGGGSATGYRGNITGIYDMGPVTTVSGPVPLVESAPVSGTGSFSIFDGTDFLTATVAWVGANSLKTAVGSVATLGLAGNLSAVSYTGTDPDLLAFAAGIDESAVLAFTFPPPGKSLAELTAAGAENTSAYSGLVASREVAVPDSGTTLILLGMGLFGLSMIRRRSTLS